MAQTCLQRRSVGIMILGKKARWSSLVSFSIVAIAVLMMTTHPNADSHIIGDEGTAIIGNICGMDRVSCIAVGSMTL